MKKFFKALALVLALTLVIGVIPASAADAKVAKAKLLYVDGAKGTSVDGTDNSTIKGKVAIYKLAGYTADTKTGHKFSAVVTGKEGVVDVTKKYVVAAGMGKTTVDILVDGEVAGTTTITVKKNASDETVSIDGLADGDTVVAGKTYTVALARSGKDTDSRRLSVNGTAVAEKADAARQYDVTFPAAGEYTIVAEAYQSAKYDGATGSKTIKVTAVLPEAVSAKQVSVNSFAITFASDMTGLIAKDNFGADSVYTKIGETNIAQGLVKDVKVEGEVVTVTMYTDLAEKTEYFVAPTGNEVSFKTAESKLANVDKITLEVAPCYKDESAAITVKYYNADGVELTLTAAEELNLNVSVDSEYAWKTAEGVYFYESGKSATVKAVLTIGYDSETNAEVKREASVEVTSTTRAAAAITATQYTLDGNIDHEKHTIRMGAAAAELLVKYTYSDKTNTSVNYTTDASYTLKSADEKIAMINASDEIFGVNPGSTTIIVLDSEGKAIKAFAVTVAEANKNATATLGNAIDKWNINAVGEDTAIELEYVVKDSDGTDVTAAPVSAITVNFKQLDNNATVTGYTLTATQDTNKAGSAAKGKIKLAISGTGATEVAVVRFTVEVKSGDTVLATKSYAIQVANYNAAKANKYDLKTTETALDASLKYSTTSLAKTATITVVRSYNGFNCGADTFTQIAKVTDIPATVASAVTTNYVVVTTPDSPVNYTAPGAGNTGSSIALINLAANSQAKKGTYTAIGYRCDYVVKSGDSFATLSSKVSLGSVSVNVTANDPQPTVEVVAGKAADALSAASYKATWEGKTSADGVGISVAAPTVAQYKYDSVTGAYYVYKVTVTVPANTYGNKTYDVTINKLFK